MRSTALPLELRHVSERTLQESVHLLNGYVKFVSMLWIRAFRQPILDSVFVQRWSVEAERSLRLFADRHGVDEVLIRIDTLNRRWSERRGGYTIGIAEARKAVRELNREGRIVAFLEPLSPYRDHYSLAAVTDSRQESMMVEIVGPGFDASDLLRSDSLPHERYEILIPTRSGHLERSTVAYRRQYLVSAVDYKHTIDQRLAKIGAKLSNPAYPRSVMDSVPMPSNFLIEKAVQYLESTKQNALLNGREKYEPIPKRFLERFASGVAAIVDGLGRYNIRLAAISVSGSFTERGRFVFWDFFPADLGKANQLYLP